MPSGRTSGERVGRMPLVAWGPRRSITHYERAIRLLPRRALAHLNLAVAAVRQAERRGKRGDTEGGKTWLDRALRHFQTALRHEPENVDVLLAYATLLRHLGRLLKASSLIRRAQRLAPIRGDVHASLGVLSAIRGEIQEADLHFTLARLLGAKPDPRWETAVEKGLKKKKKTP